MHSSNKVMKSSRMTVGVILTVVLIGCCLAADTTISLNDYNSCDQTHTLGLHDQVIVEAGGSGAASSFSSCQVTFIADTQDGTDGQRLCFFIETMDFLNNNLQLQLVPPPPQSALKTYSSDSTLRFLPPFEYCTEPSEVALLLKQQRSGTGSPIDIRLRILVRHIKSYRRIVYLDSGCGQTHDLLGSTVSVLSRQEGSGVAALSPCSKTFRYVGTQNQITACLQYEPKPNCRPFSLRVFDGADAVSSEVHTYSCTNSEPRKWCSERQAIKLELAGDRSQETQTLFSISLKDGPKDEKRSSSCQSLTSNIGFILYMSLICITYLYIGMTS